MPEAVLHISSAVVRTFDSAAAAVTKRIGEIAGCEVAHAEGGRMVVIIEGPSSGVIGDRLAAIALIEGVVSANMVYEQIEPLAGLGEPI